MAKISFPVDEVARIAALESYDLMDSGSEKEFDAIAKIASVICNIPISLITFIDEDRQWFKSHIGTELSENEREISFCTHAIASREEILIVHDARMDERFADNPMVTGPTKLIFYAGVPLINEDGHALGTICVLDQKKHILSDDQIDALKSLAVQVVDKIELRRKISTLQKTNEQLTNSNILIQKFSSMAAHDIKNPLTSILLTSQLLKHSIDESVSLRSHKLIDMNISSSQTLLGLVDEMLEYSKSPEFLIARKQKIILKSLFERLLSLLTIPENFNIEFSSAVDEIHYSSIALEQILLNLLTNAIRYNDKEAGLVKIELINGENFYNIVVSDNGIGIAEEHLNKVFDSHYTIGGVDRNNKKGTGIGLSTVKDLVNMLDGSIEINSALGKGTNFILELKK